MRTGQSTPASRWLPAAAAVAVIALSVGTDAAADPKTGDQRLVAVDDSHAMPSSQEIAGLFQQWDATLATGDPNRVADRYARDAVLVPTLSNQVRADRAGIVDYFTHFLAKHPRGTILESHIKVLDANSAIDTGRYRFTFEDGTVTDARYTFEYEKHDGRWLIENHHSSRMPEG